MNIIDRMLGNEFNIVDTMVESTDTIEIIKNYYALNKEDIKMDNKLKRDLNDTIKAIKEMDLKTFESYRNDIKHSYEYITYKSITEYEKLYLKRVRDILDIHIFDRMSFKEIQLKLGLIEDQQQESIKPHKAEEQQQDNKSQQIYKKTAQVQELKDIKLNRDLKDTIKAIREMDINTLESFKMDIKNSLGYICYKSITEYEKMYLKRVDDILNMHFVDRMSFKEIYIKLFTVTPLE